MTRWLWWVVAVVVVVDRGGGWWWLWWKCVRVRARACVCVCMCVVGRRFYLRTFQDALNEVSLVRKLLVLLLARRFQQLQCSFNCCDFSGNRFDVCLTFRK